MLPFGVTIPATVPQGSEIPEGLMNNPVINAFLLSVFRTDEKSSEFDSIVSFLP
jgi:hypothetical protein